MPGLLEFSEPRSRMTDRDESPFPRKLDCGEIALACLAFCFSASMRVSLAIFPRLSGDKTGRLAMTAVRL